MWYCKLVNWLDNHKISWYYDGKNMVLSGEMFMENFGRKKLPQPTERRVLRIKGSLYVCIPKKFVDHYDIRAGSKVTLLAWGNMIPIVPVRGDS